MSKIIDNLYLIAAVDQNWAIGNRDGLLFRIPADLQLNFRAKTLGEIVIMGRNTYKSLPGEKPLSDRLNIVLSRCMKTTSHDNVLICKSLDELWIILNNYQDRKVFVAGGAAIYKQLLPYCSLAYITKVLAVKNADRHMADLDKHTDWELVEESSVQVHNGDLRFFYTKYKQVII